MPNNVTLFGIEMVVDPIAFKLPIGAEGWTVYWYGVIIALGFILALVYGWLRAPKLGIDVDRMMDVVIITTPCAILCARAYYVLFDPNGGIRSFKEFFLGREGEGLAGLAIYGGVIGAVLVGAVVAKIRKVKILDLLDLASVGFLIGQGVGRWGNFFNQEAFGGPTGSTWWGMTSENVRADFYAKGLPVDALAHPCFLYESIWCIAGAVLLFFLSRKRRFSGETALMYCVWYGLGRAIIEPLRTDSLMIGNFKVSFLLSMLIVAGGIAGLVIGYLRLRSGRKDLAYETMFDEQLIEGTEEDFEEELEETETEEIVETEEEIDEEKTEE